MAATARVSGQQIREALQANGGNVAATARALGMARNNLYKRIPALNLDPDELRAAVPKPPPKAKRVAKTFRQSRSFYLRPEQFRALEEATFDLGFARRERFSPSRVLEAFMDAEFDGWLRRVLDEAGGRR